MGTMIGLLNGSSLAMMCSIGHRTGLFDAMAGQPPTTSEELAERTGLNERYVREWLHAMAAGAIVEYDASGNRFSLPEEHQALVTRAGGPLNIANTLQFMALMGAVEDDVVKAFETGEGVPYSRYPAFQALMAEQSATRFDAALLNEMIPNMPGAVDRLTAGTDMADVGCGSGHALLLLAEAYPNSRFTGFDFSAEGVATANAEAADRGLSNVTFVERDAAALGEKDAFDIITTFDAIHDQAHPKTVLAEINRALRSGGSYLCVEPKAESDLADNLADPMAPYMYTISTMHCMSVSIAGGGEGLGTAWGTKLAIEYLSEAGFTDIDHSEVRADRTNTHFVCRKP
ncbi:MAG: class I SAM-dependent methyltransferase [Acidimicrobiales bacterium]